MLLRQTVLAMLGVALAACGEREAPRTPSHQASFGVSELAACSADSLRPVLAAPAHGLWTSDRTAAEVTVSVLISASPGVDSALAITRAIETIEVHPSGDTVRARSASVSVSLELLPRHRVSALGGATMSQSVAVYAVSPEIRLAAYEPCAMSSRVPRVRYVRRDADGRIITDVMLRRASN